MWTIRIARIGGIAVDVHLTFGLVILWGAWQGWEQHRSLLGMAYGVAAIILLFACVLLHELGHGLQARRFGLVVRRITLLPIGGLAQLEAPPAYPWHELVIAAAGPLVNLALGVAIGLVSYLIQPFTLSAGAWLDQVLFSFYFSSPNVSGLLTYLTAANLVLFAFNMLPAFPMDGGRVVRSAIALLTDYELATRLAAWLGRAMALGLCVLGVIGWPPAGLPPNPLLLVLGVVVYSGARHEELYVRRQRALVRVEVGDVSHQPTDVLSPWDTVTRALITQLFKYERTLPVVVDNRVVGLLSYHEVEKRLRDPSRSVTVAHVMRTDFPTLKPRDTLWVALQEMSAVQLPVLPVVHNGSFHGVVSLDDISHAWRFAARRQRSKSPLISGDVF